MTPHKAGYCKCINEPRGNHGLEGYSRNKIYKFEECCLYMRYFRVYPDINSDYYETCGPFVFHYYFKEEN